MKTSQQKLYKVISYILGYPQASFFDGIVEAKNWLDGNAFPETIDVLNQGLDQLLAWDLLELQEHYVALFDFKEATTLHLTAHEYGDGRERGKALLQLKQFLRDAGYEELNGELPDYIPLLLEFLAEETLDNDSINLVKRLSLVMAKILNRLDVESPYVSIFAAAEQMLAIAVQQDSNASNDAVESDHLFALQSQDGQTDDVDLEEMPYPMYYEH